MLKIVEYIQKYGLHKLKSKFDIKIKYYDDRIVLNYDHINSSKYKDHDIVKEARSLILRYDPNIPHKIQNYDILSRSFDRFFNYGEIKEHEDIEIKNAIIQEKRDGTLINVYHDLNKWCISTRGTAFAETNDNFYYNLYIEALSKYHAEDFQSIMNMYCIKHFTYIYELTSYKNRIVTPYNETDVRLLAIRNKQSGLYFKNLVDLTNYSLQLPPLKVYNLSNYKDIVDSFDNMNKTDEGYVVLLGNDTDPLRLKIKNPEYLIFHKKRCNGVLNIENIYGIIYNDEKDEWLSYFPEDEWIIKKHCDILEHIVKDITHDWNCFKKVKDQKDYAFKVKDKIYSHILFNVKKSGESIDNLLKELYNNKKKAFMRIIDKYNEDT